MPKSDRTINESIVVGDTTFEPGDEAELAKIAPQWNLKQMADKGWISGDWSEVGVTPEEEAEANAAAAAAATKPTTGRKRTSR